MNRGHSITHCRYWLAIVAPAVRLTTRVDTVDFTSHRTPVAVAAGNLWFVCSIGCNINVANRTNHKCPAAASTGVPSEVNSTVERT